MREIFQVKSADEIAGLRPYIQNKDLSGVDAYFKFLRDRLRDLTQNRINELNQISHSYNGDNSYIQFYAKNLFGIYRAMRISAGTIFKYDKADNYDNGNAPKPKSKYDILQSSSYLPLEKFKVYIKWILDYREEQFTLGWLLGFFIELTETDPAKITLEFTEISVNIVCPQSDLTDYFRGLFDKVLYPQAPIETILINGR